MNDKRLDQDVDNTNENEDTSTSPKHQKAQRNASLDMTVAMTGDICGGDDDDCMVGGEFISGSNNNDDESNRENVIAIVVDPESQLHQQGVGGRRLSFADVSVVNSYKSNAVFLLAVVVFLLIVVFTKDVTRGSAIDFGNQENNLPYDWYDDDDDVYTGNTSLTEYDDDKISI